jgi:two-component system sensor histidine kinase RegB
LLLIDHHPIHPLNLGDQMLPIRETGSPTLEQCGLFVSFIACSSVIVYFLTRLTDELRQQQADLRLAQQRQLQSEKMEALGTLAAGAAHELATPLSTIAVVAREVEKSFEHHPLEFPGAQDVIDDVHLIRQELDRCRKILDRMASHAGETVGEAFQFCSLKQIVAEVLAPLPEKNRIQVVYAGEIANTKVKVPLDSVGQALRGLVQNALDAGPYDMPVRLHVELVNGDWQWTIRDSGSGMPDNVLQRISEPFFTTKPAGKGMGLGLFLAKNVIRRLGGQLEIESAPGRGTTVKLTVPRQATATGGNAVTPDGD